MNEPPFETVALVGTLIPIAGIAFITIAVWLGERRKEKIAFYRSEVLKKIAESEGEAAQKALEMIRQQDIEAKIRRREGIKLGGLITLAAGVGISVFLAFMVPGKPVWLAGLIVLLVGGVLAAYGFHFAPNPEQEN